MKGNKPLSLTRLDTIDNIITTLSHQNDPRKLHNVAKELLSMQKLVKTMTSETSSKTQTSITNGSSNGESRKTGTEKSTKDREGKKSFNLSKYQNSSLGGSSYQN